jgi:hypothetical protein
MWFIQQILSARQVLPLVSKLAASPKVAGLEKLVNDNGQAVYDVAIDYVAYRIAWHLFKLEQAERRQLSVSEGFNAI